MFPCSKRGCLVFGERKIGYMFALTNVLETKELEAEHLVRMHKTTYNIGDITS